MSFSRIFFGLTLLSLLTPVGTAGWVVAGGPLEAQANSPVTVANETANAHGYNTSLDHVRINETVEYEGVSKHVNISLYTATATKYAPNGSAIVTTVTLPAWRVGGTVTGNPLAYLPLQQVFEHVSPHVPMSIESMEKVDERSVRINGSTETVAKYRMTTTDGDVGYLYLSRVTLGDDLVVTVGAHPKGVNEEGSVLDLIGSLGH